MHVITKKRLDDFVKIHPDCRSVLEIWYRIVKNNNFSSFVKIKEFHNKSLQRPYPQACAI